MLSSSPNQSYYLNKNATSSWWWTISPHNANIPYIHTFFVSEMGSISVSAVVSYGALRPAVSLKSNTDAAGLGTSSDPYIVI